MSGVRRASAPLVVLSLLFMALRFVAGQSAVKGGYYSGGTSNLFPSSGLDARLFTHLFYAFAYVDNNTATVLMPTGNEVKTFSSDMKIRNPNVLTLISIWASGAELDVVLNNNQTRQDFISSSISNARLYHFDGIDLDWEFEQSQQAMDDFGLLVAEWRQAVIAEGKQTSQPSLLLTAAVYFNSTIVYPGKGSYPIAAIADNLDFINVMAYDYHGGWNVAETGANTNLYDNSSVVSTDRGIKSWLDAGMPPEKIVLGLTLYGRSWTLKDQSTSNGLGAPAIAVGPAQPLSQSPGIFFYSEVVSFIAATGATVVHNMTEVTGYCYANNVWVSFEDETIVGTKVLYIKDKGLRGYFFWQISQDNNFQVSTAASQTLDTGVLSMGPASAPSSAGASTTSLPLVFVALLCSILLLLRWGTVDIVA